MELKFSSNYQLQQFAHRVLEAKTSNPDEYSIASRVTSEFELEEARTAAINALTTIVELENVQACRTGKLEQAATVAVSDFVRKMTGREEENAPLTVEESKLVREMLEKANELEDEDSAPEPDLNLSRFETDEASDSEE